MTEVEACSWFFVYKEWDKMRKMPSPDKGFEEIFREYLYRKVLFDTVSDVRDVGLGLSYLTFSGVPHELDIIAGKDRELFVLELKHYQASDITKETVFTFLGKVMDFFFRNVECLANHKINMLLVTINRNIDDSIRKLCIAFGIKLIEPSLMTLGTMEYFARDLYQKMPEEMRDIKLKVESLIENIITLREECDYTFSDIFKYKDGKLQIVLPSLLSTTEALRKIKEYYNLLQEMIQTWKLIRK